MSKVLERSVYNQLYAFLQSHGLLYELQSGFRSQYSTDSCLIHLLDFIRGNNEKGLFTGMIMLDLQKAFDTVDHSILCEKLESIGVNSVNWFYSYLSNRVQYVSLKGETSEPYTVTCGVIHRLYEKSLYTIYTSRSTIYTKYISFAFCHIIPCIHLAFVKLSFLLPSCALSDLS